MRSQLPRLQTLVKHEELHRLLPGYVRRFVAKAAPLVGIGIEGDLDGIFSFRTLEPGAQDWLLPVLETYPERSRNRLTVYKPTAKDEAIFLHPGEQVFERFRSYVCARFAQDALRGGVFVDPNAQYPYLFHLAIVAVYRKADPSAALRVNPSRQQNQARDEILISQMIGLKQESSGQITEAPVEYLTLLNGGKDLPSAIPLMATAQSACELARAYALEHITQSLVHTQRQALIETQPERENFLRRGYDFEPLMTESHEIPTSLTSA